MKHPVTPDGRYFVVRGRLWRMANPALPTNERETLVADLMTARRAVGAALRAGDQEREAMAREAVDRAKHALGERGPIWWQDGAPDLNRHMARTTPYADWFAALATTNQVLHHERRRPLPRPPRLAELPENQPCWNLYKMDEEMIMSDDKTLRAPQDSSRIAMGEDYEVEYWTKRFGVSREKLQSAVDAVGNSAGAVEEHLKR